MRRTYLTLLFLTLFVSPSGALAQTQDANQLDVARRILHEASQLVQDIPGGQQSSAVANIAGQLAKAGDLPGALSTVRILKNPDDQALPLGIVAWAMDHAGNNAAALQLLENSNLGRGKENAYQQLALSHLDRGDFRGAQQIMNLAQGRPYLLLDMLIRIAKQRGESHDLAGARGAIGEAIELIEKARKEDPNCLMSLVGVAVAQTEIGDQAGSYATLNRFSEIVHQLRPGEGTIAKDSLLQQLASGQAEVGDLVGAFRTLDELPESLRSFPLGSIAMQQAKSGDFRQALLTASSIPDPRLKALNLREVAILEGTTGGTLRALEAIDLMPNPGDRADALATLALEQAEKEDPAADRTLQLAKEAADDAKAKIPGHVLGAIAVTQALRKDFAGAQQSIASMKDAESRVWPLWNITAMMAEADDVEGALSLADNEQAAHPKAYALLGTAQGILSRLESESKAKSKSGRT